MTEGHIYIYGEITGWQDDEAGQYGGVNLKNVVQQLQANSAADVINVHIHSVGGDVFEGFAIHDALRNSGKQIVTTIEGLCASIATVVALAGDVRKMTENSQFMIHNPWGFSGGEASDMRKTADLLEGMEFKISDFYATKTGGDAATFRDLMKAETWMTAAQAKEYGFVTDIISELKVVAKFNINEMDLKFLNEKVDKLMSKVDKFFSPKNLIVTMGDGVMVEFGGDEIKEVSDIAVGTEVKPADENPLREEYVMTDGTIIKVADGKVSEIVEAEPKAPEGDNEEVAALKQKIADLEAELSAKNEALTSVNAKYESLNNEVVEMKSLVSDIKDDFEKIDKETKNGEKKSPVVSRKMLN